MAPRKDTISSPLEAGTSILDAHHLPPLVIPALEFTSAKLAKRSMHVTLVVVRRDYQLPSLTSPLRSPGLSTPSTPSTPGRFNLANGPVTTLKNIVRVASNHSLASARSFDSFRSTPTASPTWPSAPRTPASSRRLRWPLSPTTPLSPPPMTPCTPASTTASSSDSQGPSSAFGMRLVYASDLRPKDEKFLNETLAKAEQKFGVSGQWLSAAMSSSASGLSSQLINLSLIQNEVLYSSDSLTLLSLDRLYRLKSALSSYHRTKSAIKLEDAVDELRRIVLATNSKQVSRADLLRSYDWLSVSSSVITDLDRMYRRAYGSLGQASPISGMSSFAERAAQEPRIRSDDVDEDFAETHDDDLKHTVRSIPVVMKAPPRIGKPPSPNAPMLKIQTKFSPTPRRLATETVNLEDGDRTARPTDRPYAAFAITPTATAGIQRWNDTSIDHVISAHPATPAMSIAPSMQREGPMTPNESDDISPTTRGEWGFFMGGNALSAGRTVAIETF